MSGSELQKLAESIGLRPVEVSRESGISDETLRKVYRDETVRRTTKIKVELAIKRLAAKVQAVAV